MTIKEFYQEIGSDYEQMIKRLGTESLILRFALKFPEDQTYRELESAMGEADGEKAFRAAHTLKGVCLNLGFSALGHASSELTEAMRENRKTDGCEELMKKVSEEYEKLLRVLQQVK